MTLKMRRRTLGDALLDLERAQLDGELARRAAREADDRAQGYQAEACRAMDAAGVEALQVGDRVYVLYRPGTDRARWYVQPLLSGSPFSLPAEPGPPPVAEAATDDGQPDDEAIAEAARYAAEEDVIDPTPSFAAVRPIPRDPAPTSDPDGPDAAELAREARRDYERGLMP